MGNTFALPIIRLAQRLSMVLTLGCFAYVIFFLVYKGKDTSMPAKSSVSPMKSMGLVSPSPEFDLKPYNSSVNAQARDIFSMTPTESPSGPVENTPKGQLPDHFKIVGILISHPSQIIIEDTNVKQTYFIDEGKSQAGIKIVRVSGNQMIINYQGQDISVPITKN